LSSWTTQRRGEGPDPVLPASCSDLRVAPDWFELLAWVALGLGLASAPVIVADVAVLGNWQHMAIMDLAFPLTALYLRQIGMMLGFVTSWPVNRRLLRHGIKEPMPTV
jgi:hypothetical protein